MPPLNEKSLRTWRSQELRTAVGQLLRNPDLNLTEIARRLDISQGTVWKIQNQYFPELRAERYRSAPDKAKAAVQERRAAVGQMLREGRSHTEIASQLHMDNRTVMRIHRTCYPEIPVPEKKKQHIPDWMFAKPKQRRPAGRLE